MKGIYPPTESRKEYQVSIGWPDGSRSRHYARNRTLAVQMKIRAEDSKRLGNWREVRDELGGKLQDTTIRAFSARFLDEYCQPRLKPRSIVRYVLSFKAIHKKLGGKLLKSLTRKDVRLFVRARSKEVSPATVNRDVAALKKMLAYARECEAIPSHPLAGFSMLKEPQKAVNVISMGEYRALIKCTREDFRPMLVVIGETAIRKAEAMALTWENVDIGSRMLTLEHTKNGKVRQIPLSDLAVGYLERQLRYIDPHVFISRRGRGWVSPEKPMRQASSKAGLTVRFHDLRRFRCTRWISEGVDIRTVKKLMGHASINTTMRYAAFIPGHAEQEVRGVQRREAG